MGLGVLEAVGLLACASPAVYFAAQIQDTKVQLELAYSVAVSICCFFTTLVAVPQLGGYLFKRGLKGRDMGRRGTPKEQEEIPSALGIVSGVIFLAFLIVAQLWAAKDQLDQLANFSSALLSICFMVLLGFADDVLDLPWRYKLLLPTVAALPLVACYRGVTSVLVPNAVRGLIASPDGRLGPLGWALETLSLGTISVDPGAGGALVDLGLWYLLYMLLLAVFTTNAVNIYAGINGLEAGQSLIIALAVLTANAYELAHGAGSGSPHLFSAHLILPFLASTAGLLYHNTFPAAVFVGDTYCYFAGMTLACAAILGHFSKTLLLFLVPQVVNFLYSTPQLFKVYPCPRHRLPAYDARTDTMGPSSFTLVTKVKAAASAKGKSGQPAEGEVVEVKREMTNFTVINAVLTLTGPLHERTLTNVLLALQVACCAVGLGLRYAWGPGLATPVLKQAASGV